MVLGIKTVAGFVSAPFKRGTRRAATSVREAVSGSMCDFSPSTALPRNRSCFSTHHSLALQIAYSVIP